MIIKYRIYELRETFLNLILLITQPEQTILEKAEATPGLQVVEMKFKIIFV